MYTLTAAKQQQQQQQQQLSTDNSQQKRQQHYDRQTPLTRITPVQPHQENACTSNQQQQQQQQGISIWSGSSISKLLLRLVFSV
ncbi:hypothetical protein Emag_006394 [Eimeria magna]